MRRAAWLLIAACGCGGDEDPPPAAAFAGAWSEFLTADEVRGTFGLLAERKVALHLAWSDEQPELLSLAREAALEGVEVRPWLLLPEADGYWPGATNAAAFAEASRRLMDVWGEPATLIVDMEMQFDRSMQLAALLAAEEPDLVAILTLLRSGIDREGYAAATGIYAALVDEAHARGWRVLLTTLPQVLDDYEDGDDDIRQAFGIPLEGIAWDAITFQAYSTLFGDFLSNTSLGPYFVYDYAARAVQRFDARAGVDVGLVSAGVSASSVYEGPIDLQEDLSAALAAGVPSTRIHVYALDGIVARIPSEAWLEPPAATPAPPADQGTEEVRATSAALDGALDAP